MRHILTTLSAFTIVAVLSTAITARAESFNVGFRQQTFATSDTERIDVALWYPTKASEASIPMGPHELVGALNAAALPGKRPLILISHGTGGNNLTHHEIAAALAKAGFIAAALTHPGDNARDRSMLGTPAFFTERPRQISRVIDALLADGTTSQLIDRERIGVVGHSSGGFAATALLGGQPSVANLLRHCAANYDADNLFCRASGSKERATEMAKNAESMPTVSASPDPRIKAAILIAPVGAFFPAASLQTVTTPVRLYVPGRDEVLNPRFHGDHLATSLKSVSVVRINEGGHFMPVSKFNMKAEFQGTDVNGDPSGFDRSTFIDAMKTEMPKWFNETLR